MTNDDAIYDDGPPAPPTLVGGDFVPDDHDGLISHLKAFQFPGEIGDWFSESEWAKLADHIRIWAQVRSIADWPEDGSVKIPGTVEVILTSRDGTPAGKIELTENLYTEISEEATREWLQKGIRALLGRES